MEQFQQYFLEYATREKAQMFGSMDLKTGLNGKNFNRAFSRKNINTVPKTYDHKHPILNRIISGTSNNVPIGGAQLQSLLAMYDTKGEKGVKSLGNSGVEVEILDNGKGILRRKQNGSL